MKLPKHPFRSLSLYLRIFGASGLWYAALALVTGDKKAVRVARHWSPHPLYLRLNSSDLNVFRQVFIEKEYQIIEAIPDELGFVIDAGANIGLTSLFIAARHPMAQILAVELEASNFELLRANTRAYKQIRCIHGALWHRDEPVGILSADANEWAYRVGTSGESSGAGSAVRGYRVRSLAALGGADRISLLKMDIEGAEMEVLEDAADWVGQVDNIVIELHEHIRPGCTALFGQATRGFATKAVSTELTLVARV